MNSDNSSKTPNPRPYVFKLEIDTVDDVKRVCCKEYENCLDTAYQAGWPQFTCNKCTAYVRDPNLSTDLIKLKTLFEELFDE